MKAIVNARIILKDCIKEDCVLLYDEKIMDIVPKEEIDSFEEFEEVVDAQGNYVAPGLIDVHIHGSGGSDVMDGTFEALNNISKAIVKNGVTSFLPTTMTMSKEHVVKAFEKIKEAMNKKLDGAKVQGAHMEGPFINPKFKGAQNEKYIMSPDYELIEPYLDILKIITMAPEMDENNEFINKFKGNKNIRLSMGHTNASFEEAMNAIDNGVTYATHTFNAMTGLHHREPGVVGAVFSRNINCELIADTIHVHPGFFQAFIDINKKDKVILITDSMRAGCLKSGEYDLGGQKVLVDDSSARLEDGTLAGSILKLNEAVRNVRNNTNFELFDLVNMASLNQAKAIGLDDKIGSIEKGKIADLVIFDEDINAIKTIIEGNIVYEVKTK